MKNLLLLAGVVLALTLATSPILAHVQGSNCKAPVIVSN
jgi:hypothetical protein